MLTIHTAGYSHRGTVREGNDDFFCLGPFVEQEGMVALTLEATAAHFRRHGLLVAVADGMGGYRGGAMAARLVLETLSARFYAVQREEATPETVIAELETAFATARKLLEHQVASEPDYADAGSTVAGLVFLPGGELIVFHVGDSRILRIGDDGAHPLTVDHTPLAEQGGTTTGAVSPSALALTRSFSLVGDSRVEYRQRHWIAGQRFLLGTDGWHGLQRGLSEETLYTLSQREIGAEALVRAMVEEAVTIDGRDNATLVVVNIQDGAGAMPAQPAEVVETLDWMVADGNG